MTDHAIKHLFVQFIPDQLDCGVLYISIEHATAVHKCFCGCGREVVTPLSPVAWQLTFDGVSVSLYPSIGNWNLPCRSHYFIERNKVIGAPEWSEGRINVGRQREAFLRKRYYRESS
jgi:hypothetical protein